MNTLLLDTCDSPAGGPTSAKNLLARSRSGTTPFMHGNGSLNACKRWSSFLRLHARGIIACDFFVAITATFPSYLRTITSGRMQESIGVWDPVSSKQPRDKDRTKTKEDRTFLGPSRSLRGSDRDISLFGLEHDGCT